MRPEGWNKLVKDLKFMNMPRTAEGLKNVERVYEAGADAMLEGLKKEGEPQHLNCDDACSKRKGYLVFIPEEKE